MIFVCFYWFDLVNFFFIFFRVEFFQRIFWEKSPKEILSGIFYRNVEIFVSKVMQQFLELQKKIDKLCFKALKKYFFPKISIYHFPKNPNNN